MTTFWIICAGLIVLALPFLIVPIWRGKGAQNKVLRDAANLEILRDQASEMEADLKNGLLSQENHDQGVKELQARLLEEVAPAAAAAAETAPAAGRSMKVLAIVVALLLPAVTVPLYLTIGNTTAIEAGEGGQGMSHDGMLRELERKVERSPGDPNELVTLARAYVDFQRYPEAIEAYRKLSDIVPDEPQVWVEYAHAVAKKQGGSLLGEPEKLVARALELDGTNNWALGMSGSIAMEKRDYYSVALYWQRLLEMLPPSDQEVPAIRQGVEHARMLLSKEPGGKAKLAKLPPLQAPVAANTATSVSGKASLSPAMAAQVQPGDTVFILARAANGPRMPLAVLRKQVSDLPLSFELDDSMAMQPQFRLSAFSEVVIVAKVSKSGNPISQPGDIEGVSAPVKVGTKGLNIVIDTVVQ